MEIKSLDKCPWCTAKRKTNYYAMYIETGDNKATVELTCYNCNKQWYEIWQLTSIEMIK